MSYASSIVGQAERDFGFGQTQVVGDSEMGQEDFLTLLVAQLANQDPMNPMEDKEFTSQLAQFSSLEQLTQISDGINNLAEADVRQEMLTAASFIGKEVRALGDSIGKDGTQISSVYYDLDQPMASGYINIFDEQGNLLRTDELGAKAAGSYEYTWDGLDYQGQEVDDGVYYTAMAAETAEGRPVLIYTDVSGEVTGVSSYNGSHYLRLGDGRVVDFMNVKEVVNTSVTAGTTETSETTETAEATE